MRTDRRRFLAGALASMAMPIVGCRPTSESDTDPPEPAPDRDAEPEPWLPAGTLDEMAFPFPVQIGDATASSAVIVARTLEPHVTLVVVVADGSTWTESRRIELDTVDGFVRADLTELHADAAHAVVLATADGRRSPTARFRTALGADGYRKLVLAATSCFGGTNPNGFENAAKVAGLQPDVFLLLGDSVYADGSVSYDDYRVYWERWLSKSTIHALFGNTSVIACWDDHEVSNDWTLGPGDALSNHVEPEQLTAAITAFREGMPMSPGPGGSGFWRKISFGTVLDVIVLDSRGERDDEDRIVSDEQLAWAIDALRTSTASFKVVMASVHLTDHTEFIGTVKQHDRWQGYPLQREPLVTAIAATRGAFVVTGDMHYGAVQRLDPEPGAGWSSWEIAAGPVGSTLFPVEDIAAAHGGNPPQYEVLVEGWTSSRLVLDPGTMTVVVEFIDDTGAVVATATLSL